MPVNTKVSSVAAQEPSDAVEYEGVVAESSCDAVATQETPKVEDIVVTDSPHDVVATQETPVGDGVVTESLCDAVASRETANVGDDVVTESQFDVEALKETCYVEDDVEVVVIECVFDATNINPSEIDAFNHDVNAFSAVESSEGNIPLSMDTDFSLNIGEK